jgi:predicted NBD/HSP70 family sugar kinase
MKGDPSVESTAQAEAPRILAIDIGGTNLKVKVSTGDAVRKVPSGPMLTPKAMVAAVNAMAANWEFDVVSIGYPGPVVQGEIIRDPKNLGPGWVKFDFAEAFGKPVKIINDAAMQAIGSYEGGTMLFVGLGTGLGTAVVGGHFVKPLELGHLRYKKGKTYEDFVGRAAIARLGKKRWRREVRQVVDELSSVLHSDEVVIGGGNAKLLKKLQPNWRLGSNAFAFTGGLRMWGVDAIEEPLPGVPK